MIKENILGKDNKVIEGEILKDIVVIYHGNCIDGFTGAYVAYKKFGNNASYLSASERDLQFIDVIDKEVYMLDFCLNSKSLMKELERKNKKFVVLDHHISSKEIIESLKDGIFDSEHSGAYMTHKYFFPEDKVGDFIEYVSDNDVWSHKLENFEEIISYISSFDLTFSNWELLESDFKRDLKNIIEKGSIILKMENKILQEYEKKSKLIDFLGYKIYAVNAPSFIRDKLGNILANKTNTFSLVYNLDENNIKCSLRGNGKIDVSKIAERFGGGGHFSASAFIIKDFNIIKYIIEK